MEIRQPRAKSHKAYTTGGIRTIDNAADAFGSKGRAAARDPYLMAAPPVKQHVQGNDSCLQKIVKSEKGVEGRGIALLTNERNSCQLCYKHDIVAINAFSFSLFGTITPIISCRCNILSRWIGATSNQRGGGAHTKAVNAVECLP